MDKKINEIATIITEKINSLSLSTNNYVSTENMLPNFNGITQASSIPSGNVSHFRISDILISNIRPYFRKIWFSNRDGGCSNDVIILRANEGKVLPKYLYYALTNDYFINYYVASCKGTKMPRGNKDALLEWVLDVPSREIQQHIVNTIGSVDDLIENKQKQIDKICLFLEVSLQLYEEKRSISEYAPEIIKSGINKFDKTKNYLDTSCVEGINNISSSELIEYNKRPSRANMQPIANSVWFAKMKDSNKILIITDKDKDILSNNVLSTGFLGIKASSKLPLSLLASIVISNDFKIQRDLNSVGTTMAGVNNETFLKIQVPYLNENEALAYEDKYSSFVYQLSSLRREIDRLKLVKKALLKKYF